VLASKKNLQKNTLNQANWRCRVGNVTDYVRSEFESAIPGKEGIEAIAALEKGNFPMVEPKTELEQRIHLAILKTVLEPWSREKQPTPFEKFQESFELGMKDWRDLLCSAGLHNDDWRKVLKKYGLTPPIQEDGKKSWWKFW
jgi:hypothetical protein